MNNSMLHDFFATLDWIVMEYHGNEMFKVIGETPDWFNRKCGLTCSTDRYFKPQRAIPFLEHFMADAFKFWATKSEGQLKSGLWIETEPSGQERALEATALNIKSHSILFIEPARFSYIEKHQIIQKGRELQLSFNDKERLEAVLRQAQQELEKRVKERTAELSIANALLLKEIDERKQTEKEKIQLATAVDQAAEAIMITDTQGVIEYVSPAFQHITGYTYDEAVGKKPDILKSGQHDEAFYQKMWAALESGEVWRSHFIDKRKDGKLFEAEVTISPVRDAWGEITNYVAVNRDVTHEVMMEKHLRQTQKMEAIGTLAGGIAHDFNNILAGIMGYTEMCLYDTPEGSQMYRWLKRALQACERGKALVNQILMFSRAEETEQRPMYIKVIVKEALKLLQSTIPSTIKIRHEINDEAGAIIADTTEIHQVLINLCTNAIHAMGDTKGVLAVMLDNVTIEADDAKRYIGSSPGDYVQLTVSDNGCGMDADTIEKIFEPFFTTKKIGEGTGMGLSVVHGIIKRNNGFITVYSHPDEGSTFQILFPRTDKHTKKANAETVSLPTGQEHILLVDDDALFADMTSEMLTSLGYILTSRTSSIEALEVFRANPARFDLVITDQTMPHIKGTELAEKIKQIRPDVPIILCTGFSELITSAKAHDMGIAQFIMKPFVRREMAVSVRRALDLQGIPKTKPPTDGHAHTNDFIF